MPEHLHGMSQDTYYIVGSDTQAESDVGRFLREECHLKPISREIAAALTKGGAPFPEHILDTIFEHAQIVIFLLMGEEQVHIRKDFEQRHDQVSWKQPTQDQLFEAGYAFGRYPDRVFVVRRGQVQPLSDIDGRHIYDFDDPEDQNLLRQKADQLARRRERRSSSSSQSDETEARPVDEETRKRKRVFVVFGRNTSIRDEVRAFLWEIGLSPIIWGKALEHTGKVAVATGEVLEAAFSQAWAVVVLLTGDDLVSRGEGHREMLDAQPRANVLFEAGMAFGNKRLENKTILIEFECDDKLKLGSHVKYRQRLILSNSTDRREEFIRRLRTAGCIVDLEGKKWHSRGNFDFAYEA